jgi:type VI secretion system protein ImpM
MSGVDIGFFGKLPSHGDFIERRVASAFRVAWDDWLQRCMIQSRHDLGGRWLDCYLTSPMWRFFLSDGVAGSASYAGILLPSVDRAGRYFPLTVVATLPVELTPLPFAELAAGWFSKVEQLCAGALEDPNFELTAFDRAMAASEQHLAGLDQLRTPGNFPGRSTQWRWPVRSVNELATTVGATLMITAQAALRPMTMWWTDGSDLVSPSVLVVRSLPRPESFADLLAGGWNSGQWDGETAVAPDSHFGISDLGQRLDVTVEYQFSGAGATDPGIVRTLNEDNYLLSDNQRTWAVADGLGGHSQGEVASQMVVDALGSMDPTASLNAALEAANLALARVNADLRRAALGVGDRERSGSTVVMLVVRGGEWGVFWAGDSRAYLFRAGELRQLTSDHTAAAALAGEDLEASLLELVVAGDEITRAVGAEDEFQLDTLSDLVADGDRFLLCSDGLHSVLGVNQIVHCLQDATPEDASKALVEAARAAGAPDNVTAVVVAVGRDDSQDNR